jgi:hypothetical protein
VLVRVGRRKHVHEADVASYHPEVGVERPWRQGPRSRDVLVPYYSGIKVLLKLFHSLVEMSTAQCYRGIPLPQDCCYATTHTESPLLCSIYTPGCRMARTIRQQAWLLQAVLFQACATTNSTGTDTEGRQETCESYQRSIDICADVFL